MYTLLITFALLSLVFSFLCSLWEAVLLSITPSYAEWKQKQKGRVGKLLQSYKQNIDQPLVAILTLNTIAHTVGAIGVGAQAFKIWHDAHPMITGVMVPTVMTLAILILSEIIPKTLGVVHWKKLVSFTVVSIKVIITVFYPIVWVSQIMTKKLKKNKSDSVFSRSEFLAMAEMGEKHGVFEKNESAIINNLLLFDEVKAEDIMTPRTVVLAANEETSIHDFYHNNKELRFSRVPIYQKNSKDHMTGYVLKDQVLDCMINEMGENALSILKREIIVVKESFPIPELFNTFIEKREHIALVVDEFGGTSGIVTMEDVIETLLGLEIMDEVDKTRDMQILARRHWERRAKSLGIIEEPEPKESSEPESEEDEEKSGN